MNIAQTESPLNVIAKTCGCEGNKASKNSEKGRKVTYSFVDTYHSLCLDKKSIISSQLEACERLLKYSNVVDQTDAETIQTEISELKMVLDLMH
jgi:hypothetical protein